MISCMVSVAWSHHVLSFCCTEHSPYRGAVLTDRITSVAMSSSCQLDRCCTVATCTSTDASITHERALKTHKANCVSRATNRFFIPVVYSPTRTVGHVTAPELPSQEDRARSRETRGSTGAHFVKEARSRAEGHMTTPELTSAKR
jgi:hypothetical protein